MIMAVPEIEIGILGRFHPDSFNNDNRWYKNITMYLLFLIFIFALYATLPPPPFFKGPL